jgi:aerobic carbon-monoxide dehydrogenase medium subunit
MPIKGFYIPTSLEEAAELLNSLHGESRPAAGCTDLMVQLAAPNAPETSLVSLRRVPGIGELREESDGSCFVGSLVRQSAVAQAPWIRRHFPALAKAAGLVGSPSIRNRATIGGNICNASPSADTALPLLAYDAEALIWGLDGERTMPLAEFFLGPGRSALRRGEILKGLRLRRDSQKRANFEKLGQRKAMEIAIVNACASVCLGRDGTCFQVRIALGAVAPTPIRAREAEAILEGKRIDYDLVMKAAAGAAAAVEPISDVRASAEYRRRMAGVLTARILSGLGNLPCTGVERWR